MAMVSPWGASKAIFVAGSLGILSGCGSYTSDYVPPKDGRARVVWVDDRAVASLPSEALGPGCSEAVRNMPADPAQYSTYYGGSSGVVYYRPWIRVRPAPLIIVSSGGASNAPRSVHRTPAAATVGGSSGGGSGSISGPGGSSSGKSGGSGGGGGGGGGDLGKAAVVLAVVALLTLPIITLSLGLSRPEPEGDVANAIDDVNAYNDLARLPDSPCTVVPAEVAQ